MSDCHRIKLELYLYFLCRAFLSLRKTVDPVRRKEFYLFIFFLQNGRLKFNSKTSFEKNCFSAWASTLNMGLINKVDMVCLSPVGYGVFSKTPYQPC